MTEPSRADFESAAQPRLARQLGLFDATMLVMGGMVGAGIFINPYVVARQVHTPVLILGAWIFGGIIGLTGAFIWAELAATLPEVGGQYAYFREAYHPAVAFLYGWVLLLVIQTGGMAAVSITFARYFRELTGAHAPDWIIASIALGTLTLINCLGVKTGGRTQSALMVMKIVAISALVIGGFTLAGHRQETTAAADRVWSVTSFGGAMVPVLFAYGGWQTANFIAAEVKEPKKNLPRGLLIGMLGVALLYTAVNWIYLRSLGPHTLAATSTPATAVMRLALGQPGATLIAAAIAISTVGHLSQSILTAPRVYFAMADDGLFFRSVAWLDPRTRVPVIAIVLQSVWTIVIAISGRYEQILNYVIAMDFLFFGLTAVTVFVFRRRAARGEMPASAGYRIPGHPFTTAIFVAICWWVVGNTIYRYPQNSLVGFAILIAGIPAYLFWTWRGSRQHIDSEIAVRRSNGGKQEVDDSPEGAITHYMAWAKLHSAARFNLAVSGMLDYPLAELPVRMENLEIGGTGPYGYKPLMQRLAKKAGVPEDCLVYTLGASMANFVALTALLHRGDEVLVERPTYDPLLAILNHVGARVSRFERRAEKGFRLGIGEFERRLTAQTRLVVLCNLHNPSGALSDDATLRQVGEMAAAVGARVLVDEVYLETLFDQAWRSSFHLSPNFIVTSSLTKAYGLSGIRCGWILAQPELAQRMWQIIDFTYAAPVHPAECMAVIALDHLDRVRDRARALLEPNRALVNQFLAKRQELDCERSRFGTTVFPRLRTGRVDEFVGLLRERFETSVVPGDFFEQPQHFRIGFSGKMETVRGGLERLDAALDAFVKTARRSTE